MTQLIGDECDSSEHRFFDDDGFDRVFTKYTLKFAAEFENNDMLFLRCRGNFYKMVFDSDGNPILAIYVFYIVFQEEGIRTEEQREVTFKRLGSKWVAQ